MALKRTTGNYLNFAMRNFPLDCEGMDLMQQNNALQAVMGNIGGDKYILKGCNPASNYEGYVFLATASAPDGELLYVEPKPAALSAVSLYVATETVDIFAQGYNYAAAYTTRWLRWGVGTEQFAFADFTQIQTNKQLAETVADLQNQINDIQPTPKGIIAMWGGQIGAIPEGWRLCDGNNGVQVNGVTIPDLRGRFVVGYNSDDSDYNGIGKPNSYNLKTVTLTQKQMPKHSHYYYVVDVGSGSTYNLAERGKNSNRGMLTTETAGEDQPHENRPPYYVLAYIIKVQ